MSSLVIVVGARLSYCILFVSLSQGDSTLHSGLACLVGPNSFCDAVNASQSADGRCWRNPCLVNNQTTNSFSRDMSLGVMAFLIKTKNALYGQKWVQYITKIRKLCPDATDVSGVIRIFIAQC